MIEPMPMLVIIIGNKIRVRFNTSDVRLGEQHFNEKCFITECWSPVMSCWPLIG